MPGFVHGGVPMNLSPEADACPLRDCRESSMTFGPRRCAIQGMAASLDSLVILTRGRSWRG